MNTRRRGSLTPSLSEEGDHIKRNAMTNTKSFQDQTTELGQAPVFNIHIHLPANNDTNASKMYLPRIQPIIHVHFDELADKLRNKASPQERGCEKYLETLIQQITPKFGNILFHRKNSSFNGHSNSNEINNLNPNQDLREKDSSIALKSSRIDTRQKKNAENSNKSGGNGPSKKTQGISGDKSSNVVYSGYPIKLKKAVVVLEDILQPNLYKSGRVKDLQKGVAISQHSSSSLSNTATHLGPQIKGEPVYSSPRSPSVYESDRSCAGTDNFINSFSGTNSFGLHSFEFSEEGSLNRESLASLAEGCYFSDILKKFKEKYRKDADESLEESKVLLEAQTLLENMENNNVEPQNYVQGQKEGFWVDDPPNVDHKQEEEEDSKYWVNLQGGLISHEFENHASENSCERNAEISEWSNCVGPSVEESRHVADQMQGDLEMRCSLNTFHKAEVDSDNNEITNKLLRLPTNKLSSEVVEDLELAEYESSNPTSDIVIKSEFNLIESNDFIIADTGNQCFDLSLVKKEMVSPKKGIDKMVNKENKKSREDESGSSPKKFKKASKTAEESTTKAPKAVDYLPLKISGPTEFGVVPLSKVQGYKAHSAQTFKKDMLFGKRTNRFPNPEHLRMYKLKKVQKHCQNKH